MEPRHDDANKYGELKKLIKEWIEGERENVKEARELAGVNSPGCCMAMGAIDAYEQVLRDIRELECVVEPQIRGGR